MRVASQTSVSGSNAKSLPVFETIDLLQNPYPDEDQVPKPTSANLPNSGFVLRSDQSASSNVLLSSSFSFPVSREMFPLPSVGQSQIQFQFPPSSRIPGKSLPSLDHGVTSHSQLGFNQIHSSGYLFPNTPLSSHAGPSQMIAPYMGNQSTSSSCSMQPSLACQTAVRPSLPSSNLNTFHLKWLSGTRVSKCYGSSGEIQNNPPLYAPDDLVIMYRDI